MSDDAKERAKEKRLRKNKTRLINAKRSEEGKNKRRQNENKKN